MQPSPIINHTNTFTTLKPLLYKMNSPHMLSSLSLTGAALSERQVSEPGGLLSPIVVPKDPHPTLYVNLLFDSRPNGDVVKQTLDLNGGYQILFSQIRKRATCSQAKIRLVNKIL